MEKKRGGPGRAETQCLGAPQDGLLQRYVAPRQIRVAKGETRGEPGLTAAGQRVTVLRQA